MKPQESNGASASLLLSVRYLNQSGQRLFAWLGVIAENAPISAPMAAVLWSTTEKIALKYLHTLSGAGLLRAVDDTYRIHDLMQDLARNLLTAPASPARGDIPGLGLTWQDAVRHFLERYRAKVSNGLWHTLPDDGYIHDHLVRHLGQAGWESEFGKLLWEETADGYCGWYQAREQLDQMTGFQITQIKFRLLLLMANKEMKLWLYSFTAL